MSRSAREFSLALFHRQLDWGESCILIATCTLNGTSFPATAGAEGSTDVLPAPARLLARFVKDHAEWHRRVYDSTSFSA